MSDLHVLAGSRTGGTVMTSVACHYTIPAPDRIANASLAPDLIAFESEVPNISPAELDAIKAGQGVELVIVVKHHHSADNAEILALARAEYANAAPSVLNDYRAKYWQYLEEFSA